MLTDMEIAAKASLRHIADIAAKLGIEEDDLDVYGRYKVKVSLDILAKGVKQPRSKYIIVTAITPTPLGEGKTVTTIGLSQALSLFRKRAICCIRQPSMGPTFGIKGGAAGAGFITPLIGDITTMPGCRWTSMHTGISPACPENVVSK